jgi:breast cancer 2 susceptibility protein
VLEAYNSTKLVISGNSSHLAPWHVKLGFQSGFAPVCTMNKLTPDGGAVGVMDLTVLKAYPVAFLEFVEEESGEKRREGPWNEKEEARLMDKWRVRCSRVISAIADRFWGLSGS